MSKPRHATQIQKLAKEAITTLNSPPVGMGDDAKAIVTSALVDIITIAAKMDARTGTIDPRLRQ